MVAGFAHAPLTKSLILLTTTFTLLTSLFRLTPYVHLQLSPHLFTHHQYYRLLTQHFAFTNSSELLLALILLYNTGVKVERCFGTRKFAAFVVVTTALCTGVQVVLLGLGVLVFDGDGWIALGRGPAGPFALTFSILYQYSAIIPHLWSFRIGHLTLTDKHITVYALAILLSISQSSSTLLHSLIGILISSLYRATPLAEYRIPARPYRIASLAKPWIGSTTVPQRSSRAELPERRTLQAREARLALHNASVASVSGGLGGGGGRLSSLLRRRGGSAVGGGGGQEGMAGVVQQQRTERMRRPDAASAGGAWNDVPPPPPPPLPEGIQRRGS